MDYIRELNAFRDWTLLNRPSTGQIALWYSLMSVNNMTGWATSFVVANSTLELMTGLSKGGLEKARAQLIAKGLIEYEKGTTRQAGRYQLVPFCNKKVGQSEAEQGTNQRLIGSQSEAEQGDINKLKETKRKENTTSSSDKEKEQPFIPYQQITNLYHEICVSLSKVIKVSNSRKEHIGARYKQYGYDIEIFKELFIKAQNSDFLKGGNPRKWKADFDWLMNEANMAKVLEGKYEPAKEADSSVSKYKSDAYTGR